jgi:hypothetical protein
MPVGDENCGLLRRRLIFADPERSVVRISPDGARVAFRAPIDGVLNLWVAPIDRVDEARPVTAVTDRNLGPWIVWMRDNRHVVFFREAAGDENWRAWRVDLDTGDVRPLTPGPGVTCYVQQSSRHFPSELLIAHNERDKRYFDIYRVNVATGESELLQLNEGVPGYFTDQQFRVRFAVRYTEDGDVEYLQRGADGEWALFSRIGAEDAVATRAIEFSADGRELYWLDSRGHDTAAVVAQDLENGAMRVLAEDPRADFTGLLLDPITERPVAAARSFERVAWQVLDPDYRSDFDYLTRRSRGDLTITSMSQDRRHWIAALSIVRGRVTAAQTTGSSSPFEILDFWTKESRALRGVLADAGQRSRAIIPGDDPGDQQPPERRGLYPDPDAVAANARLAQIRRYSRPD